MSAPSVSAFSSLDAHNGCRALFNGAKGWAYIGPAGSINPADYPGTVSYDCVGGKASPRGGAEGAGESAPGKAQGKGQGQAQHARVGGVSGGGGAGPSRPGEGVGRKTSDVRSAYLDAEDLEHLLHEVERCAAGDAAAAAGAEGGVGGGVEGVDGEQCQPRRGRPIVLTLQAILAATASPPPTTAATASESGSNSAADSTSAAGSGPVACSGENSAAGSDPAASSAADFAASAVFGTGAETGDTLTVAEPGGVDAGVGAEATSTGKSEGFSGASDLSHFPPLALLGSSAGKEGLFLAPPITMVRGGGGRSGGGGEEGSGGLGLMKGVSCSDAVTAEAMQGGGAGGGSALGGLSRVGWWLRWATSGADNAGQGVEEGGGGAMNYAGSTLGSASSAQSDSGEREIGSFETRTGVDGWQVVSSGSLLVEQVAVGEGTGPQGSARAMSPTSTTAATAPATTTAAVAAAKAVAMAGGAWALMTGGWTGTVENPVEGVVEEGDGGGHGEGESEDDAASWCDCASDDVGQAVEEEAGMASQELPECPVAVSDGGRRGGRGGDGGDGGEVLAEAEGTTIEVALQCAVNSPIWDNENDYAGDSDTDTDNDSQNGTTVAESVYRQQQQEGGSSPRAPRSPRPSSDTGEACTASSPTKTTPISFRDILMAPSSTGAAGFVRSKAFRDRVAAAAAGGVGGGGRMPPRSLACSAPTLVDGGTAGGAVYLWRKAAAGQGGKAADSKGDREDEDPYYARKRVGAFAFKTKPRGKAHK